MNRFLLLAGCALMAVGGAFGAEPEAEYPHLNVPVVKGLIFTADLEDLRAPVAPDVTGVVVKDIELLRRPGFERVVAPYLGRPLNEQTMRDLQTNVVYFCRSQGRPVVDVIYLQQEVSNGVLRVLFLEGKLAGLEVQDPAGRPYTNGWTRPKFLTDRIRLEPGGPIDEPRLRRDLDWLNRSPFRTTEAWYKQAPGKLGESEIILRVEEERPIRPYIGYEDTGSRLTDFNRVLAGFDWGKPFGLQDHVFNYRFTADPAFEHLRAHTAGYSVPLPWRNTVRVFGYYLDSEGDLDETVTLEGSAYQTSLRYDIPLPFLGPYQQEVSVGLDFKHADNNLIFNAESAANTPTDIFQCALGYSGLLPDALGGTSLSGQFYYSPGGVTDQNSDEAFDQARAFAASEYYYGRLSLGRQTGLPGRFAWVFTGTLQLSSENLLPSEQLGLGGYTTVRGYDEREVNTDQGWILSNEIRTPAFSPLMDLGLKQAQDRLQLLGFFDYGVGHNRQLLPEEDAHRILSSVGVGLRLTIRRNLELRFDYGWQLTDAGTDNPDSSRGHIVARATF